MNEGQDSLDPEATAVTGLDTEQASLSVLGHPREENETFVLPATEGLNLLLGRGRGADLDLDDTRVSRQHARISAVGGRHFIEDLGSVAGTDVNGAPADGRVQLKHGDRVQAGSTGLVYSAPGRMRLDSVESLADDTATALPNGGSPFVPDSPRSTEAAASYRRALTAVVIMIGIILAWMLLETFE